MAGDGFTFRAPSGWHVRRGEDGVTAARDSELVRVATFELVRPYRPALYGRVAKELAARMATVAKTTGGTVGAERSVTVDGVRSHAYVVTGGDHVDQYTFVLAGSREYQLLCRRKRSGDGAFCEALVSSFART